MPQFLEPSLKALQAVANDIKSFKYKEEFDGCPIGMSFQVLASDMSLSTLRPLASRQGKALNRKFRVVDHTETQTPPCFEVYRLPDPDPILNQTQLTQPVLTLRGFQQPVDNPKPSGNGLNAPRGWPSPEEAMKEKP